jgi:hypothetical protein
MDQPRTTPDLMSEAHRRAMRSAPPPEMHPLHGGLVGAAAFCVPMFFFESINTSLLNLGLNAAVGFALGFFYLKRRQAAYDRACERELEALKGTSDQGTSDASTQSPAPLKAVLPAWMFRGSRKS